MKTFFVAAALFASSALQAQGTPPIKPPPKDSAVKLGTVQVTADRAAPPKPPVLQLHTLPVTASITAQKAEETVNLVDTEDAVKYLPSVFLRKRNNGDTQATLGTRVWGVSSSARSLVFVDGVPLTALVANNNTIGGPRWGLVSPAEIARIDMMYGPFSAAYAGNSMGAVMEITTRLPQKLEGSINQTQAVQTFSLYGTDKTFSTTQTAASVGNRYGKLAFWASGSYQNSHSQPLSYVTSASFPNGTTGGFADTNKLGAPANVIGAGGLQHTSMTNAKVKLAYDLTPAIRAAYTFGYWQNDGDASVQPFATVSGQPTFAGLSGFASGTFAADQKHHAQTLSLRSDTKKRWDFEAVGTQYRFDTDRQRTPVTASSSGTTFGLPGRIAILDGTGWTTFDLKMRWVPAGPRHTVSLGVHHDTYEISNTTFNTPEWTAGKRGTVFTEGDGKTQTRALWAQDAWSLTDRFRLTVGGRYERWRAFDGLNINGSTRVEQSAVDRTKFSPKAVLAWNPSLDWVVTTSIGRAYRFATPSELYQLVSTGATFTSPNPDLKPDDVVAAELRVERIFNRARVQAALFQDDVHDAIIAQFLPLVPGSTTLYSYASNVDHVRARGAELTFGTNNAVIRGLELSGSVTYVNARTLATSGRASATAPAGTIVGKRLPNIPDWRASFATTYRRNEKLSLTLGGRYSGKIYTTLDNADVNPNTYQGFAEWFVMDTHVNYRMNDHWSAGGGVDNLLNRKYFLFHPFPQRTFVANVKFGL